LFSSGKSCVGTSYCGAADKLCLCRRARRWRAWWRRRCSRCWQRCCRRRGAYGSGRWWPTRGSRGRWIAKRRESGWQRVSRNGQPQFECLGCRIRAWQYECAGHSKRHDKEWLVRRGRRGWYHYGRRAPSHVPGRSRANCARQRTLISRLEKGRPAHRADGAASGGR
jgi:hypothetical protein